MKEEERQILEIQKRVLYFYKEKVDIHVKMKSGYFYNGKILEVSENDFFIFIDAKLGEMPLFFIDIKNVERYLER